MLVTLASSFKNPGNTAKTPPRYHTNRSRSIRLSGQSCLSFSENHRVVMGGAHPVE